MKQTLAMLFVTALLLFSLAGCGEKKDSNTANGPSTGTTDNGAADSGKKNGNLYGKTYLNPETEKSANAQLRSNGRSLTGANINGISNDVRYRQMLSNGRVHDTDGFLFDGENTHYNTLK